MKKEIININTTRINFICTFDKQEEATIREQVIQKFCKEAKMPGFRQGKVPQNIVVAKMSPGISQEIESTITNKTFQELEQDAKTINVASIVDIKNDRNDDGFSCTLSLDIFPEFELTNYRDIRIEKKEIVVPDSEIDDEIKSILRQYAKYEVVERPANKGDFVKLSYAGTFEDGALVSDNKAIPAMYGTQENTWEEAGDEKDIGVRAIVDGIVGAKAGDKLTVTQHFDEKCQIPELVNKTVTYKLEISEIRECVLPDVNEEMLKSLHVESEDDLKNKVKDVLQHRKASQQKNEHREQLVTILSDNTTFDIPESAIETESKILLQDLFDTQLARGTKLDDLKAASDEILKNLHPAATSRVKIRIILEKIAKKENIDVSANDVENMIWHDIRSKRLNIDKYVAELKKDRKKLSHVRSRALCNNVLTFLEKIACGDDSQETSYTTNEQPIE